MNLKMKTLAAAMIAAGSMASAQAAEILFPYVVNSATVTTVVNVINHAYSDTNELHYVLWYKDGATAEDNGANCLETNSMRSSSFGDIQTIDLGGKFGTTTLGVLFNDPSVNNNYMAAGLSYAYASFAKKPMRGWLMVQDEIVVHPSASGPAAAGRLQGEAMVFDFSTGAAWGYQAGTDDEANGSTFDASSVAFENAGAGAGIAYVGIAPFAETTTKFFVTPLVNNGGMLQSSGNNNDNASGTKDGYRIFLGDTIFAMFDRDENIYSGSVPQDVTCVGSVNAPTLLSGATLSQLPNGGWSWLFGQARGVGVSGKDVINASVIKLDYNTASTFNGDKVPGVFNNAFVLKSQF